MVLLSRVSTRVTIRRVLVLLVMQVLNVLVSPRVLRLIEGLPRHLLRMVPNLLDPRKLPSSRAVLVLSRRSRLGASELLTVLDRLGAGVLVTTPLRLMLSVIFDRLTLMSFTLRFFTLKFRRPSVEALNAKVCSSVVLLMENMSDRLTFCPSLLVSLLNAPFANMLMLGPVSRRRMTRESVVCVTSLLARLRAQPMFDRRVPVPEELPGCMMFMTPRLRLFVIRVVTKLVLLDTLA